tara:strand:- start:37 stop:684 length:648 start_codon:yes stop_codon:yes gene_type:complete
MTYLELINDVLVRLRETTVSTTTETTYSTLIGKFVNDAKRQIEDAFSWNALGQTITVTTAASTASYSLTGAGQKFQVMDVINTTSNVGLINISFVDMNRKLNFTPLVNSIPTEFAFDGVDASYDTKVNLYPIPDGAYTIKFALTVPQATLSSGSTVVLVSDVLVAQNAYARALVERGEDGGLSSSEAYLLYKSMLSDQIALEGTRYPENQEFVAI